MYASRLSLSVNQLKELFVTSKPYNLASRKLSAIEAVMIDRKEKSIYVSLLKLIRSA